MICVTCIYIYVYIHNTCICIHMYIPFREAARSDPENWPRNPKKSLGDASGNPHSQDANHRRQLNDPVPGL